MDSFLTFINHHRLDLRNDTTLLTVSGGVDSVVMAHLFYTMGFKAAIAHCHFGLRGEESDRDERFVRDLAGQYGFDFYSEKFETKKFAQTHSISTQMAARDLRYEWFEEIRAKNGYQWIATAHHANDSIETVLLNLARGTGPLGLQGISAKNQFLIRPLLFASKEAILDYAKTNGLPWREDRSNDSDDYKRNLIRHKVTPVLQLLNPSLEHTFNTTSKRITAANNLLDQFLEDWKASVTTQNEGAIHISISKLLISSEPAYRLWYLLDSLGFSYQQSEQIVATLPGISGKKFMSSSHVLLIDRTDLIINEKKDAEEIAELKIEKAEGTFEFGGLIFNVLQRERRDLHPKICDGKNTIILDPEKLIFPLLLRRWVTGDVFCPFGMEGKKKKLSDLFIDLKLSRFQKDNVCVLQNGNGEIIWVVGLRSDERYRVDDATGKLVMINVRSGSGLKVT